MFFIETFSAPVRSAFVYENIAITESQFLIAIGSLLVSGCVVRERVVYRQPPPPATVGEEVVVTGAPPAPFVETVAVSPGPGLVWIGGCWVWRGHWVWEHGRWVHPPASCLFGFA